MMRAILSVIFAITSAIPAMAEDFHIGFPVDCDLGENCFIEDYMDHDPSDAKQDFACGINTRDGHKGTDIALISYDDMERGVAVTAAASGRVLRVRDEMPDDRHMRGVTSQNACGNAVLVEHQDGWRTLYCHLKLGSVRVAPGQTVKEGEDIGEIGLSGQTNHPHLHLGLYHRDTLVDPFKRSSQANCGAEQDSIWRVPPAYYKAGLITTGFSDGVPKLPKVVSGEARRARLHPDQPLVLYAHIGHAQDGDVLEFMAVGPEGDTFSHRHILKAPKVSQMQAYGRKAPREGWPAGTYVGEVTLRRESKIIAHRFTYVKVD
jgi:hypothetical protein